MLVRTQLLLDPQTKRDLEYLSQMTDESMSSLVRRFVAEKVKTEKKKVKKNKPVKNPTQGLIEFAKKMDELEKKYGFDDYPTDWSINHDYYLYGLPKKNTT